MMNANALCFQDAAALALLLDSPLQLQSAIQTWHSSCSYRSRKSTDRDGNSLMNKEADHETKASRPSEFRFLDLPYDIRYVIYRQFCDVGKTIHLTTGQTTRKPILGEPAPARYHIPNTGLDLMLACHQTSDELRRIVYGCNTFLLSPGEINHNMNMPYPHSVSNLWLHGMTKATQQRVKRLEVHLASPRPETVHDIAQGLAGFPNVRITLGYKHLAGAPWVRQRELMMGLCKAVAAARTGTGITFWDDAGDIETAYFFLDALPPGFLTAGKTAFDGLDEEEAWI